MSDQKIKTASGKVPLNLLPLRALKGVARVFGYGAKKYAKGNWYTADDGEIANRYAGGFLRHLADAQNPDGTFDFECLKALDAESGLPEIDHALCGLIMLRGLLAKHGALPWDPGEGKEPPSIAHPSRAAVEANEALSTALNMSKERIAQMVEEMRKFPCVAPDDPCDCRDCVRNETTAPLDDLFPGTLTGPIEMTLEPDTIHPPGDPPKTGCSCAECSWLGLGGK